MTDCRVGFAAVWRTSGRPWLRALVKRVVSLLLGFAAGAVLVELLSLVIIGEQPKFPRHVVAAPWGLRYNQPGAKYHHRSADVNVLFEINAAGMRAAREYEYQKPAGVKRIVSLGDSFTLGYEVELEQCFSTVLENELRASGLQVEVLNAGVAGFSTAEEYVYLERELLKYEPDLVIVSFYVNDLEDNVRADLFRLEGNRLVEQNREYVPGGRLASFLNTNWAASVLAERSNAIAFFKERVTRELARSALVWRNRRRDRSRSADNSVATESIRQAELIASSDRERRLAAALFDRMHALLRGKGVPLLVHSIPTDSADSPFELMDGFPIEHFDVQRAGLAHLPSKVVLQPYLGREKLYWQRSMRHWTPFSHRVVGRALAQLVVENGLLEQRPAGRDETAMPQASTAIRKP